MAGPLQKNDGAWLVFFNMISWLFHDEVTGMGKAMAGAGCSKGDAAVIKRGNGGSTQGGTGRNAEMRSLLYAF